MSEVNLASEILAEFKKQAKLWAIAFFVVLGLWAATIAGFIWYLNQYDFVSYSQDGEGQNYINNRVEGSVFNGTDAENADQETNAEYAKEQVEGYGDQAQ